ncbi:hypothetical protein TcBrA4_0046060 [Trypanosoma cruzi]|nr:hypothetical protein TcBrA4_0046060 [Trypanosoma cruzi]
MARTHPFISVPLSRIPGRQRSDTAEKAHVSRRRHADGIGHRSNFPVRMRPFSATSMTDRPATARHATASAGLCENRSNREPCEETGPRGRFHPPTSSLQPPMKKHGVDAWGGEEAVPHQEVGGGFSLRWSGSAPNSAPARREDAKALADAV